MANQDHDGHFRQMDYRDTNGFHDRLQEHGWTLWKRMVEREDVCLAIRLFCMISFLSFSSLG